MKNYYSICLSMRNTHTESAHGPPGQSDQFPISETAFPYCQLDESKTGKIVK